MKNNSAGELPGAAVNAKKKQKQHKRRNETTHRLVDAAVFPLFSPFLLFSFVCGLLLSSAHMS